MNIKSLLIGSAAALAAVSGAYAAEQLSTPLGLAASEPKMCLMQTPELAASEPKMCFTQALDLAASDPKACFIQKPDLFASTPGPKDNPSLVASVDTTLGPQLAEAGGRHAIVLASLSITDISPGVGGGGLKIAAGGGGGAQ